MKLYFSVPLMVILAWLLGSCGGSDSTAGIEGTGSPVIATGAVTSFGSVYVNGERFITRNASVTLNGVTASEDDIQAGMVVEIHGMTDPDSGEMLAEKVIYERNLLGTITAIEKLDAEAQLITLLGQRVYVANDSVLDGIEFDELTVGDTVEVSGFINNEGLFESTRLEEADVVNLSEVSGKVSQLDRDNQRFRLRDLRVDYSEATFGNGTADDIEADARVKVKGSVNSDNTLLATQITFQTRTAPEADTRILLEGIIDSFTGLNTFTLDGYNINAADARIHGGRAEQLQVGVRVSIEGVVDTNGNVDAKSLRLQLSSQHKVRGTLEDLDPQNQTLTVLGTTFVVDSLTAFEDRSIQRDRFINFETLAVGDNLEVFGREIDGELVAVRIKRLNSNSLVTINGPVSRIDSSSLFFVMDVQVDGSDAEGAELISSFTPGTRVLVEGIQTGSNAIQASLIQRLNECKKTPGPHDCDKNEDDEGDSEEDGDDDEED